MSRLRCNSETASKGTSMGVKKCVPVYSMGKLYPRGGTTYGDTSARKCEMKKIIFTQIYSTYLRLDFINKFAWQV